MTTFRVIGPGRAGRSLLAALAATGEYEPAGTLGRGERLDDAARGVDLLIVATPDDAAAEVASAVEVVPDTAVVHLSGSLGLDVLAPHPRRGSLHPLVPLPNETVGAARLRSGVTFAVAGDPITRTLAASLGGRAVEVDDARRGAYHAAAVVAANHLVALLGQVERLAEQAGLPLEAFAGLVRAAADDALALGPSRALTGPAARGDWNTLERHRTVIAEMPDRRAELAAYDAMVGLARRLALGTRVTDGAGAALGAGAGTEQVA